ncbi:hypothetical protein GCM10022384_03420 [Streptomyces marokkonensis]|uniref:Uncharacterized protein n=1 Tax=Streptomyces marokkonensis TaxID=324855 RepID=A0ABP7NSK3_9ACTN
MIEELHLNEQRIVAPSLGFDAARVLAHALRARRVEAGWAAAIVGLWIIGWPLTGGVMVVYLLPSLLLAWAVFLRGDDPQASTRRKSAALVVRWLGRMVFALFLIATLVTAFSSREDAEAAGAGDDLRAYLLRLLPELSRQFGGHDMVTAVQAWLALLLFVVVALCAGAQRSQFARALNGELSPERFPDAVSDPAEQAESPRFQRLKQRIRLEQHAPMITYHEAHPFCGAGQAYDTWVLSVQMRPADGQETRPLSNRTVLDTVRPLLEGLRLPPEYAGHAVRDRLRWLEIDECVFLPAEGLARRQIAPYSREAFVDHRDRAVEEGAEKRRHFLRARVGGWEEELVVTVYVRVHTQGRMLMLEIAPHVLMPVREDFKDADRTAHRLRNSGLLGKATWAAGQVPASAARSFLTLWQAAGYSWTLLTGGYGAALPDGPAVSVRELGAARSGSLFQQMDVDRYLRSIQDRIAHGVRTALADHGYQTGEFVQKVVNISNGGVHIDTVARSTFAIGTHARATATADGGTQDPFTNSSATGGTRHQAGHPTGPRAGQQKGPDNDDHG